MTVRAGREFLAIPGPTNMPDDVLRAMHRPALDIYSREMVEMTAGLLGDLTKLFATKGQSYIYIANGHGAWEATLSNVLSVHEVLDNLAKDYPVQAEVVKLRYFVGMTNEEIALLLGVSVTTVSNYWMFARTWIFHEIKSS